MSKNSSRSITSMKSDDMNKVKIKELDLNMIYPNDSNVNKPKTGFKLVIIGKPKSGKSNLIRSIMYFKKHLIPASMVMCSTEDVNGDYQRYLPSTFLFNEYSEEKLQDYVQRQKLAVQHLPNPWSLLLIDDCTDDVSVLKRPIQHQLFKYGRHWQMLYILSLQYALDIKPSIRTSIDGCFIFREPNLKIRRSLYENYASIIPDFQIFCDIMDAITEKYTAVYIHSMSDSNNWQDCVFYYKAPDMSKIDFKFGSPEYWEFHDTRYNPEYVPSFGI